MKTKYPLFATIIAVVSFFSCSDSSENPVEVSNQAIKTQIIDARDYSKWVYFSFSKGEVVTVENNQFQDNLEWDIAFHRNDIRLNGGLSGSGLSGAQTVAVSDLANVTEAPETGYKEDTMKSIMVKFQLPVPLFEEQPANTEIDWLTVDTSTPPPVYTLHNKVFVIKTANGKYAKFKFKSYLSDLNQTMVIKFDYVYQADGSRNLK